MSNINHLEGSAVLKLLRREILCSRLSLYVESRRGTRWRMCWWYMANWVTNHFKMSIEHIVMRNKCIYGCFMLLSFFSRQLWVCQNRVIEGSFERLKVLREPLTNVWCMDDGLGLNHHMVVLMVDMRVENILSIEYPRKC